jgi:hypothetical protein
MFGRAVYFISYKMFFYEVRCFSNIDDQIMSELGVIFLVVVKVCVVL